MKTLDLFCGAGGFSLGAEQAGHDVVLGVDHDEDAIATFEENHDARGVVADLSELPPGEFADEYELRPGDVEAIIGGPPCQGVSTANVDRHVDDERNQLVFTFAEYVDYYRPEHFVMENVPELETIGDGQLYEDLIQRLEDSGYTVIYEVKNATDYGVPQNRSRLFTYGEKR